MLRVTFWLDEEVTPELFAEKIVRACAYRGALRIGEGVSTFKDGVAGRLLYTRDQTTSMAEIGLGKSTDPMIIPVIEFVPYG